MVESILVVSTPPGRLPRGGTLRVGTYSVLFLYRLLPPILDEFDAKVAPTPLAGLVETVGQAWVDRYLEPEETAAFTSGDGAWEFVSGQRETRWEFEGGPLRLETIPDLIARLEAEWTSRKAQAMADWTAEYEFTGKRIIP